MPEAPFLYSNNVSLNITLCSKQTCYTIYFEFGAFSLFYYIFLFYFSSLEDDLLYIAYTDMMAKVQMWYIRTQAFSLLYYSFHSNCMYVISTCISALFRVVLKMIMRTKKEKKKPLRFEVSEIFLLLVLCVNEKHKDMHRCVTNEKQTTEAILF